MKNEILKAMKQNKITLSRHFAERAEERNVTQTQIINLFKGFTVTKAKNNKYKMSNKEITILISDDFCLITTYPKS